MHRRRGWAPLLALGFAPFGAAGCVVVVQDRSAAEGVTVHEETTASITVIQSNGGAAASRVIEESVPAASVREVRVRSEFGSVEIARGADDRKIAVRARVSLSDNRLTEADRKRFLPGFTVRAARQGGTLDVSVQPPKGFPPHVGFGASLVVAVPAAVVGREASSANGAVAVAGDGVATRVDAHSDFGAVRVADAGAGASVKAVSGNGAVTVSGSRSLGSVFARSDFGGVSVSGPAREIEATTANGSVTVKGAPRADKVEAHSDFGRVTVTDCGGAVRAVTANGAVDYTGAPSRLFGRSEFGAVTATLRVGASPSEAELTTANGAVRFTAPPSASLHIKASTGNGSIRANGVSGKVSGDGFDRSFEGNLGSGRTPVTLHSDFGAITVSAR